MKIAIDCRYLNKSGIGRYLSGILENLDYERDEYVLIGSKSALDKLPYIFRAVYCENNPFSVKGLLKFPKKIVNQCDVFFSPNFIIPFGIRVKIFVTIHDVLFLDRDDCNNGRVDKFIKRKFVKRALRLSEKVFTVSEFSKTRIYANFPKYKQNFIITGNAIVDNLKNTECEAQKQINSLIYVGNIKKHKGLFVLQKALDILNKSENIYSLSIVGTQENFRTADKETNLLHRSDVRFTGYLDGKDLVREISNAEFLIQPSLYEGFGITPMEALYFGTKPIISDIPAFREVYGNMPDVVFFESGNAEALAQKIKDLRGNSSVKISRNEIDKRFSYAKIAQIVRNAFNEVIL